jgi:hypothetical protein
MKILRVRRGYTTNSSGSNEWVPPKHLKLTSDAGVGGGKGPSLQILSGQGATKWSKDSKQVTILATQPGATQQGSTSAAAEPPRSAAAPERSTTNLGLLGLVIGLVSLLFVGTALLRRIFKKKRRHGSG